jgi:hypothetical protein
MLWAPRRKDTAGRKGAVISLSIWRKTDATSIDRGISVYV